MPNQQQGLRKRQKHANIDGAALYPCPESAAKALNKGSKPHPSTPTYTGRGAFACHHHHAQEHMPLTRTRHCKTCNTLRYNDCKTGCNADDAGNDKNWMTLDAGRQKVTEHAAQNRCALVARLKANAAENREQQ